jgi:hypothetical protein
VWDAKSWDGINEFLSYLEAAIIDDLDSYGICLIA